VDPQRQLFFCFGCRTGGDVFKFVQLYEKVEFPEAVEMLANRWGVELPRSRGKSEDARDRLLRMNQAASRFFETLLADEEAGAECRAYLEKRGISNEIAGRLQLGYAPAAWEALRSHLQSKGYKPDELLRGGLVLDRKSGRGQYDRFRGRLMFPIRDVSGRPVAFGGRALGDEEPKYINSPETPAYIKGNHLYGLDLGREAIRREGFAVVVEGYLDLVALLQAGFDNAVASLGTAFTPTQARLLARHTNRVVFSYDGDAAGAAATARSVDLLLEKGFDVRVVDLPGEMDPDDYIQEHGAEAYGRLVRQAPEYLQFLIQRESRTRDVSRVDQQVAVVNAVLPHIVRLTSAIERAAWAGRLADALGIADDLVLQELRGALKSGRARVRQRAPAQQPLGEAEARLVNLLLNSEDQRRSCGEQLDWDDLQGLPVTPIVKTILDRDGRRERVDFPAVLESLEEELDRELLTRIAFREEPEDGPTLSDCLETFRRQRLMREGRDMVRDLRNNDDGETVDRQLQRMQELARQRDQLM
jgi:DNA primase